LSLSELGLREFDTSSDWVYALDTGDVSDFVQIMTDFLCKSKPIVKVLDTTHGMGRFTAKLGDKYEIVTLDVRNALHPDVNGDFNNLPFPPATFDVVYYDPPYLASGSGTKMHYKKKSILWDDFAIEQKTGHAGAIREIYKILKSKGLLIWKDNIIRYKVPFFEFQDLFIQDLKKTPPMVSKHAIKNYSFYAVYVK